MEEFSFVESPWDCNLTEFDAKLKELNIEFQVEYLADLFDNFRYTFNTETDMLTAGETLLDF